MARERYDRERDLVAMTGFLYAGKEYEAGDPFPRDGLREDQLRTLYGARRVGHAPAGTTAKAPPPSLVHTEAAPGGYYNISAPWLDEPERVRGKDAAAKRAAEIEEAGEPDYYRGVRVTEGENGWYEVKADWEREPRKEHGANAARNTATQLRQDGMPDLKDVVTVGETEDGWEVWAPWFVEPLVVTGDDAEAEAQDHYVKTIEAGVPEGWPAEQAADETEAGDDGETETEEAEAEDDAESDDDAEDDAETSDDADDGDDD